MYGLRRLSRVEVQIVLVGKKKPTGNTIVYGWYATFTGISNLDLTNLWDPE